MRHVTNWQARTTDKLFPYHFLSPSLTFFMVSPVALLAFTCSCLRKKLVLQTYRQTTNQLYHILFGACTLRHNHKDNYCLPRSQYFWCRNPWIHSVYAQTN